MIGSKKLFRQVRIREPKFYAIQFDEDCPELFVKSVSRYISDSFDIVVKYGQNTTIELTSTSKVSAPNYLLTNGYTLVFNEDRNMEAIDKFVFTVYDPKSFRNKFETMNSIPNL